MASRMVWPSAGDRNISRVARLPPAPGLLSTMTDRPPLLVSSCARMRATMSPPPPAAKPTSSRICLDGNDCARAAPGNTPAAAADRINDLRYVKRPSLPPPLFRQLNAAKTLPRSHRTRKPSRVGREGRLSLSGRTGSRVQTGSSGRAVCRDDALAGSGQDSRRLSSQMASRRHNGGGAKCEANSRFISKGRQ